MDFAKRNQILKALKDECNSILEEEAKKYNIELKLSPITLVEYYESDAFKQKTKLQRTKEKHSLKKTGGFYDPKDEKVIVFIDNMAKHAKVDSTNKFVAVLFASYHEFRHQLQFSDICTTPSEKFIIDIERFLMAFKPRYYRKNHNEFYLEIEANLYALEKLLAYIKEKHPSKYEESKKFLEINWQFLTEYHLSNYDFSKKFDMFYKKCKFMRIRMDLLNIPGVDIFINEENKFRSLSEIIELYKGATLDERILCSILGSESFINQLNISKLSEKERLFMLDIIEKNITLEIKRVEETTKLYNERKIKNKEYLESYHKISDKLKFLKGEKERLKKIKHIQSKNKHPNSNYKRLQRTRALLTTNHKNKRT